MYVFLSRLSNINNLGSMGKYNVRVIQVNRDGTTEYNRLQEQSKLDSDSTIDVNILRFTASLLTTGSLRRHAADISKHKTLNETDTLCFTVS